MAPSKEEKEPFRVREALLCAFENALEIHPHRISEIGWRIAERLSKVGPDFNVSCLLVFVILPTAHLPWCDA